ncbi:fungal-specific transcription factor domain-containing protein [Xylariales sp. PMI_506]|nr:fungal-specific transcription factor domain-containing protein [Xylariales sp. PMI_506]
MTKAPRVQVNSQPDARTDRAAAAAAAAPSKPRRRKHADPDLSCRHLISSPIALDRINSGMLDFLHPQLLADYTDTVFWFDSRFYQCPGPYDGNSWMTTFLSRSRGTHLAAALMGLTWRTLQKDMSRVSSINFTRSLTTLHSVVVQNVREEIERSRDLVRSEEVLTVAANLSKCASLLLIFEVWRTLEGDWIPHLRGLCDIIRWIVLRAPCEFYDAMESKVEGSPAVNRYSLVSAHSTPDMVLASLALKWSIQSYSWNDITSAVWVGPHYTDSRLDDIYACLLEQNLLEMDKFMGCEDWVLLAILEASQLEKRITEKFSSSETVDTMKEEAEEALFEHLNAGLKDILIRRDQCPSGPKRDATYVTEIWIHAAMVYLHVVTSGPCSSHHRLRSYVSQGLSAYVNLPRRLDIHTAMPFGVLASMANDEEAEIFMGIAELPRSLDLINPGQRKTFQILKECWKLRRIVEASSPDAGVSWRDGAASLGLTVLPV